MAPCNEYRYPRRWRTVRDKGGLAVPDRALQFLEDRDRDLEDFLANIGCGQERYSVTRFAFTNQTGITASSGTYHTSFLDLGTSAQGVEPPSVNSGNITINEDAFWRIEATLTATVTTPSGEWTAFAQWYDGTATGGRRSAWGTETSTVALSQQLGPDVLWPLYATTEVQLEMGISGATLAIAGEGSIVWESPMLPAPPGSGGPGGIG